MLAGSMLLDTGAGWEGGLYVFLHPEANDPCCVAKRLYAECLTNTQTFDSVTLERMVGDRRADRRAMDTGPSRQYLGWEKIDAARAR